MLLKGSQERPGRCWAQSWWLQSSETSHWSHVIVYTCAASTNALRVERSAVVVANGSCEVELGNVREREMPNAKHTAFFSANSRAHSPARVRPRSSWCDTLQIILRNITSTNTTRNAFMSTSLAQSDVHGKCPEDVLISPATVSWSREWRNSTIHAFVLYRDGSSPG
ncbi:hypothetical protein MRB53_037289 [Persea americana]|nr:hypothetical protein MRB53_037289 [Persea americana]